MGRWLRGSVLACVLTTPMAAQSLHYEGGVSVASGAYIFTERTTSWSLSSGLALGVGPFTVRGTVPVYLQNTSLLAGTTAGFIPTGGPDRDAVRDSSAAHGGQTHGQGRGGVGGSMSVMRATDPVVDVSPEAVAGYETKLGDPTLGVSFSSRGRTALGLNAGVKIPVAALDGFGTGEWDVGGGVSVSRMVGGSAMFGLSLSYWHLGDLPDLDLQDLVLGSVSAGYLHPTGWAVSLSGSGASAVIEGFESSYSVALGLTRVRSRTSIGLLVSAGLNDTAPDVVVGATWRITLTRD